MLRRPGSSWGFDALLKGLTSVVENSSRSRDSNPQPQATSSTLYPLEPQLPPNIFQHSKRLEPGIPRSSTNAQTAGPQALTHVPIVPGSSHIGCLLVLIKYISPMYSLYSIPYTLSIYIYIYVIYIYIYNILQ